MVNDPKPILAAPPGQSTSGDARRTNVKNHVKRLREDRLLSKAELARKAGISALTIDRIEAGMQCRIDTKRKIILALGMTVQDKDQVFTRSDDEDDGVGADADSSAPNTTGVSRGQG